MQPPLKAVAFQTFPYIRFFVSLIYTQQADKLDCFVSFLAESLLKNC